MIIGVNGRFLAARATGVQRFARAVLDRLPSRCEVALFMPRDAVLPGPLRDRLRVFHGRLRGAAWEQLELPRMAAGRCDLLLNLANAGPLRVRRQLVMIHDVFPLTHPQWFAPAFSAWYAYLTPRLIARASGIMASSEFCARAIRGLTSDDALAVTVVPQGIEPFETPAGNADVERVRAAHGLRSRYVLALGAGDRRKNVDFAIDVVRDYRRATGESLTLAVAGHASARVHGRHTSVRTDEGVVLVGAASDRELRALYTGAAAFLYPSLGEGFGRPPLEALCCGTPVLVSDYDAGEEVLADSPAHRLPLDRAVWSGALRTVLASGHRPDAAVRAALRASWSWDAAADAVVAACARIAGPVPAAAGAA